MVKVARNRFFASLLLILTVIFGEFYDFSALGLSHAQGITASIMMLAAILWVTEWVSLFIVSFLILALQVVWLIPVLNTFGEPVKPDVFYSAFFSNIILLFLGGFVLSSTMQKYGLDLTFAHVILLKTKGKPGPTLMGIILSCSFLSMWISNTATTAMMLTIIFPLLKQIPQGHVFRKALVLSIPFACNIGGIGTPIGTPPNAIALSYLATKGFNLSFFQWMIFTFPFLIVFLFFLWGLLMKLYPAGSLILDISQRDSKVFGTKHWGTMALFVLTALGWFFSTNLGLSTGTIALLPIIATFWFGLLDIHDFRSLPWDVLYIVSGGMALGIALNISGLGQVIVSQIPLDVSPVTLMVMCVLVAGIMSTVMSNTATAGLIIPLVMSLPTSSSFTLALVLSLAMMCSMAMALPVTTPPNAIAFSSRAIETKDMIISGGIISGFGFVMVVIFGPYYWDVMIRLLC